MASAAGTKMHALIEDFYNELRDWDNLNSEVDMTTEIRFFSSFAKITN